jgi:hypothetical protein
MNRSADDLRTDATHGNQRGGFPKSYPRIKQGLKRPTGKILTHQTTIKFIRTRHSFLLDKLMKLNSETRWIFIKLELT